MKTKVLSYLMILCLVITSISLIPTKALNPQPRVDLDEYEMTVYDKNKVYIEGTVSKARGQSISVRNGVGAPPIALTNLSDTGKKESFTIKIPGAYITDEVNIFYVYSEAKRGVLAKSNSKTAVITYNSNKKSQTITANNMSIAVGGKKSIGASVTSKQKLSYTSENNLIATVDSNGTVIGRKIGKTTVSIKQAGTDEYKAVTKNITITVENKKDQKITAGNKSVAVGKSMSIGARSTSKGKLTYKSSNSKIVKVNSSGKITGKKAGKATITIKQAGNATYKAASKKITVTVRKAKKSSGKSSGKSPSGKSSPKKSSSSKPPKQPSNIKKCKNDKHKYGKVVTYRRGNCTYHGAYCRKCKKCGYVYFGLWDLKKYKNIHDWGKWKQKGKHTCTKGTYATRKCKDCGKKETKWFAAKGHSYGKYKVTKNATCTRNGYKMATCTRKGCDANKIKVIKAKGHNYKWKTGTKFKYEKCTRCGDRGGYYRYKW